MDLSHGHKYEELINISDDDSLGDCFDVERSSSDILNKWGVDLVTDLNVADQEIESEIKSNDDQHLHKGESEAAIVGTEREENFCKSRWPSSVLENAEEVELSRELSNESDCNSVPILESNCEKNYLVESEKMVIEHSELNGKYTVENSETGDIIENSIPHAQSDVAITVESVKKVHIPSCFDEFPNKDDESVDGEAVLLTNNNNETFDDSSRSEASQLQDIPIALDYNCTDLRVSEINKEKLYRKNIYVEDTEANETNIITEFLITKNVNDEFSPKDEVHDSNLIVISDNEAVQENEVQILNLKVTDSVLELPQNNSEETTLLKPERIITDHVKKRKRKKKMLFLSDCATTSESSNLALAAYDQPSKVSAASSTVTPKYKKRRNNAINLELMEKPFSLYWKREIVHRATASSTGNRISDVYYYPPVGKKLRSLREVEDYLQRTSDTSLTIANFSFMKRLLTIHESEWERHAKKTLVHDVPVTHVVEKKPVIKKKKKSKLPANGNDLMDSGISDLNPMCNDQCIGYEGMLPNVMCIDCFCLFHPKCVGLFSIDETQDYTCKNCFRKTSTYPSQKPSSDAKKLKTGSHSSVNSPVSIISVSDRPKAILDNVKTSKVSPIEDNCFDIKEKWNYLKDGKSVNALLHVFSYLNMRDILNVKLVCSSWNVIASNKYLKKHVSLQDLKVKNWKEFADFIETNEVEFLNMRGMKFPEDIGKMWKDFISIIPQLNGLTGLILCKMPAIISYKIAANLERLKYFVAEGIFEPNQDPNHQYTCCKLYVGKFNKLKDLRTLKLRGIHGLYVPPSFLYGAFNSLSVLTSLTHLALTSFDKSTAFNLDFLADLPLLSVLELGNCAEWEDEHFNKVCRLANLKKLRLEYGGSRENSAMISSLKNLTELRELELVFFQIPLEFGAVLVQLKKLHSLTIWPDKTHDGAKNGLRTMMTIKEASHLKKFIWGLVAPDFNPAFKSDKPKVDNHYCCIPFMKKIAGFEPAKWKEINISANQLMDQLRNALPSTVIRVIIISNNSYTSVRQAMR